MYFCNRLPTQIWWGLFKLRKILQHIIGESREIDKDSHGMLQLNGTQIYIILTLRGLNKMVAIWKTVFSNALCKFVSGIQSAQNAGNGLTPDRLQAITKINHDQVLKRHMSPQGLIELNVSNILFYTKFIPESYTEQC